VTSVLRRVVAPFAAVTALVATLSACGTGPNQVNSAAIIGDRVISVDQVQSLVDKVAKEPAARSLAQQHKLDLVAREALGQLIVHDLLTEAARKEGLRVDQDQLEELRAQNPFGQKLSANGDMPTEQLVPELVYRARGFDDYASDQMLLDALAREHLGKESVRFNGVIVQDATAARELAEKIAARPQDSAGLIRAIAKSADEMVTDADTGANDSGVLLFAPKNTVFVLPSGQGAQGGGGFQVLHVLSTKTTASVDPGADLSQIQPQQLPTIGRYALRRYAIENGVKISPRYGVWNAPMLTVVAKAEADVSGFLVLPGAAKP
jgi:SurA-like protein